MKNKQIIALVFLPLNIISFCVCLTMVIAEIIDNDWIGIVLFGLFTLGNIISFILNIGVLKNEK